MEPPSGNPTDFPSKSSIIITYSDEEPNQDCQRQVFRKEESRDRIVERHSECEELEKQHLINLQSTTESQDNQVKSAQTQSPDSVDNNKSTKIPNKTVQDISTSATRGGSAEHCEQSTREAGDGNFKVVEDLVNQRITALSPSSINSATSTWLEQIQFKAHYQHFRSIDYATVVNSAVSLDRVHVVEPRIVRNSRIGEEPDLTRNKEEPQSFCWNFPRVKLRRLFNAKSLDDILGRTSRKGTQSSESSNSIHNQFNKNNAHSHSNLSRDSRSYSNTRIGPLTSQRLSGSSSENNCYTKTYPGVTPTFVTTPENVQSTTSTAIYQSRLKVPKSSAVKSNLSVVGTSSKSHTSRVKAAKSDNCLHLIVSATSLCTKIASSSVDNLDSERSSIINNKACDNNPVLKLPVPVSVQVRQIEEREQQRKRRKSRNIVQEKENLSERETFFDKFPQQQQQQQVRKRSQVSPHQGHDPSLVVKRKESESTLPKLTPVNGVQVSSELDTETGMMTKEKAKLVVANVGYLQRPLSPTPAPIYPGPSQSYNNNVLKPNTNCYSSTTTTSGGNRNFISTMMPDSSRNTQWSLSNVKCANSTYSYNNYNNQMNQFPAGNFTGSGGRSLQDNRAAINNDSANNTFRLSKPVDHLSTSGFPPHPRHGQNNDNFPSHFPDMLQNTAGMRLGAGLGGFDRDAGGHGGPGRLRPMSPAFQHPEQINNNYAIMISPGQTGTQTHSGFQQQQIIHHQQQNRCDNTAAGRRGYINTANRAPPRSVEPCTILSPQDISTHTETTEGMGDLQSPQYVKRTAHMFDSRYTTHVNGSSSDTRRNGDGTSERVTSHHSQPSYLSVSRSVCGYSCLSYNNGTTTSSSSTVTSTTTNGGAPNLYKPVPTRPSGVKSDFQLSYNPTSNGHCTDSNGRDINKGFPRGGMMSPVMDVENNQNGGVGSYNNNSSQNSKQAKSNILEKIERLYGTNAVTTASLWRRPVPLLDMPSSDRSSTAFKALNENIGSSNGVTTTNTTRSGEKIIPIFLESSRKQLSRIESADDEDDQPIVKAPSSSTTVKTTSSVDKVSDKDDLYSKHDILNSNRLHQKHTNGHNGTHTSQASLPTTKEKQIASDVPIRSSIDVQKDSVFNRTALNLNPEPTLLSTNSLEKDTTTKSKSKEEEEGKKVFESLKMGRDLFHANSEEHIISFAPAQIQEKTEDSIDGESKQIFKVVSNLRDEDPGEVTVGWKGTTLNITIPSSSGDKLPAKLLQSDLESGGDDLMKENICGVSIESEEKNGEYYLNVVAKERSHIASLIKTAEKRMESMDTSEDSPEFEMCGKILAAIGKAKLLINKKFKQFEGLCNDNIEQRKKGVGSDEPFTTKDEDLAGFWDMVLIQVDQIHSMFQDLEKGNSSSTYTKGGSSKQTESKKVSNQRLPAATTKVPSVSKSKTSANTARDESRRKMLAERRKAMKSQMEAQSANAQQASVEPDVQIFVPDT